MTLKLGKIINLNFAIFLFLNNLETELRKIYNFKLTFNPKKIDFRKIYKQKQLIFNFWGNNFKKIQHL